MSEWREETAGDLAEAEKVLTRLTSEVSGEPSGPQLHALWLAYVNIEKSVAFIKIELDVDSPGMRVDLKKYAVPDERQAIGFSLKALKRGEDNFRLGDLTFALSQLRESRNYLRSLLRQKELRRSRVKKN